jgi:glycosyltransferase involved in cell wall biosynthesis
MIKVAMIVRSTIYSSKGGDTIQVVQTANGLLLHGIHADIKLAGEKIRYNEYDLLHFFNLTRPADILYHIGKSGLPFVVSPILIDYTEYDKHHRRGLPGLLFRHLRSSGIEYVKVIARWIKGNDKDLSLSYLLNGHDRSIRQILNRALLILPNSASEYNRLITLYEYTGNYFIVPNGVDGNIFRFSNESKKDQKLVLCVARIEGIKNQLNLIRALNNTIFNLIIIGNYAANQKSYYDQCRAEAAANIQFLDEMPQDKLTGYYQKAKVHVLPSWFETTGLSSLESAYMGCNIVVTDRGDTREYFGSHAHYCDPASGESILAAVENASIKPFDEVFRHKIAKEYTWQKASERTAQGYYKIINQAWNLRSPFSGPEASPIITVDLNT